MNERVSMPQATATWLIDNTTLTFKQIGAFCSMHWLQIKAIADGDVPKVIGESPIVDGLLTAEMIKSCEGDSLKTLEITEARKDIPEISKRTKGIKYIPISKREDKPNAIAWLIKQYPDMKDEAIVKLIRTTTPTIEAVRSKTHRKQDEIIAGSPVTSGLCSQEDLETAVNKIK
jgi:uncharacterized protein